MLLAELHGSNWAASGCVRRSFFVRVLYAFKALSKISWNFEFEDEAEVG